MIAFSFYDKVKSELEVDKGGACYEHDETAEMVEVLPPPRAIDDERPCNEPIPIYLPGSRFHPAAARHFVFALDWDTLQAREGAMFTHCLQMLDVVGSVRTRTSLVTLDAMQVFCAMEGTTPHLLDDAGNIISVGAQEIDFLNIRSGPAGVQLPNRARSEALVVVVGATYVHLPHDHTLLIAGDGRADFQKTRQIVSGDRLYLVFREVRGRTHYAHTSTSRGPVAWCARVGIAYPDIVACDRLMVGHRQIGIVETVEHVDALKRTAYVRARLTLSTYNDARVLDEV